MSSRRWIALHTGDAAHCPTDEILGAPRPVDGDGDGSVVCDTGAYEVREVNAWVFLPVIIHP
ncbi:MAG TPA: hypothetical protein VI451_15475 [Anaerolineales bacterium]|nr:hypothetical protein [Anaerolineales bacterium]